MATRVNLQELMDERPSQAIHGNSVRGSRRGLVRFVVPLVLLLGFATVLGWSLRDSFWPATSVTVIPVIASRAQFTAAEMPLFRAAGWIEPRPQPVVVTALVEGIVDEILVVEGQAVEPGQTVARLIRRDSEIALQRAEADVRLRKAEVASTRASLAAAEAFLSEPIHLQAALAEADAAVAKMETELARLPTLIRAAEAKRDFSEREVAGKTQAVDAVPVITLQKAKSELEATRAQVDEHRQQLKSFERERQALAKRRDVLARQLELKVDETRRVAETRAQLEVAEAQLQQAQADRESAQLRVERTEIRAKAAGHVLMLVAKPGSRLMGIDRAATNDASTVLTMYDPRNLQVRADVRLEDVPQVLVGQAVRIETPAHPQPIAGRVLMATATTDIQKNTLQVKLAIDHPPAVLKPDMLVQATFLAPHQEDNPRSDAAPLRLWVARELIQGTGDSTTVWLADQLSGTARLRRVTTGETTTDGRVEITTGVNVGDRLIVNGRESLTDGQRVRIRGNDPSLGRESTGMAAEVAPIKSSQIRRSGTPE